MFRAIIKWQYCLPFFQHQRHCPEFKRKYIKLLAFSVDDSSKAFHEQVEAISEIALIREIGARQPRAPKALAYIVPFREKFYLLLSNRLQFYQHVIFMWMQVVECVDAIIVLEKLWILTPSHFGIINGVDYFPVNLIITDGFSVLNIDEEDTCKYVECKRCWERCVKAQIVQCVYRLLFNILMSICSTK